MEKEVSGKRELVFDVGEETKEYHQKIEKLERENEALSKTLGKTTIERDWTVGKQNHPRKLTLSSAYLLEPIDFETYLQDRRYKALQTYAAVKDACRMCTHMIICDTTEGFASQIRARGGDLLRMCRNEHPRKSYEAIRV